MKTLKGILLFVCIAILSSCVEEDLDDCSFDRNIKISYTYLANGNENVLKDYISQGTLYIYSGNKSGKLLYTHTLSQNTLIAGQKMDLPEGKYEFVVVANNTDRTTLKNINSLTDARLAAPAYYEGKTLTSNDDLYIASQSVNINRSSSSIEMKFHSSHIKFEVHVRGLSKVPSFRISDLVPEIDLKGNTTSTKNELYFPTLVMNNAQKTLLAKFNTLRIKPKNDVILYVNPESGNEYKLNLNEFLQKNLPALSLSNDEVFIPILVEFDGLSVSAKVPEWIKVPSVPGVE